MATYGLNDKMIMAAFIGQALPAYTPSVDQGSQALRVSIDNRF